MQGQLFEYSEYWLASGTQTIWPIIWLCTDILAVLIQRPSRPRLTRQT